MAGTMIVYQVPTIKELLIPVWYIIEEYFQQELTYTLVSVNTSLEINSECLQFIKRVILN